MTPEKPDFVAHLVAGAEHFNARRFWDAHESWEVIWLHAQSEADQFLQGLIQIAAAYHHLQRGTFRGGVRLFDAGLRRLQSFAPDYCGVLRDSVERAARYHREWADERIAENDMNARVADHEYPKLILSNPSAPFSDW